MIKKSSRLSFPNDLIGNPLICNIIILACLILLAPGAFCKSDSVFFCQGPTSEKKMALTFDDGPGPSTEKVLNILKEHNIKATFFMEGSQVEMRPDKARKVMEAGHEIGNHTYSHPNYYVYKNDDKEQKLSAELTKAGGLIERATGLRPKIVRMPHGYVREWVKKIAREQNYILINWTFGCDWKKMSGPDLAQCYIKNIHPGAIFLMHDGGKNRQSTVEALPVIIKEIESRGYKIVPAGELLGLKQNSNNIANR